MPPPRTIRRSSTISPSRTKGSASARRHARVIARWCVASPNDPNARNALVREVSLDAHLEDWPALGEAGEMILARKENDAAEKMLGLGARGLSKIQAGEETAATRAIQQGLELMDETRYGATGQLPVAAAMIKYANGELRKYRSEKISINPPGPDFLMKLEMRCSFLLEAQSSYADAIRSVDPQWAAMSGYRVGEMYRTLHHDLMLIPPTEKAKTEHDKQLFYGIMHVRYRVLLEKGMEMMKRTLALGEKTGVGAAWMKRAETLEGRDGHRPRGGEGDDRQVPLHGRGAREGARDHEEEGRRRSGEGRQEAARGRATGRSTPSQA